MLTFTSKLLSVYTSDSGNISLTFESSKYDVGLDREVPCSERISLDKRHAHLLQIYKDNVGKVITVPVVVRTGSNGLWTVTAKDGVPIETESLKKVS